ncbi:tail tape measure protein [Trichonephila clavata]|uniref:Tail tape measure protein n=1 Tax=Trichonephila clavata TaxID=2740835 RepID=A0A8X6EZX3_TRICU|nr:tail tape measure protein [Trichonephila clavata]
MKAIEKPSKTLKAEFDKAKTSATKAKEAYLKKRDALHSFMKNKLGSVIQKQQNALARKAHYRSQVMETIGLGLSLAAPIKVAIDFESAMADVKKVVRFAKDDAAHNQGAIEFGQTLKELSRTIPLSAAELAQIAASGGQLGIDKEELIGFTTTVAKMSTAFDMSAEEAGDSIAKLAMFMGLK